MIIKQFLNYKKNIAMTNETFLPKSYKMSKAGGKYLKLKQWLNKIRIVSNATVWRIDWDNKKPIRTKEKQKAISRERQPKEFRAFAVRSYEDNCIVSCEFTQSWIKHAIMDLYQNQDWGDPKEYDLTVNRTGEWMETKYTVQPSPKKELTEDQKKALENVEINMELLFDNWEPISELWEENFSF